MDLTDWMPTSKGVTIPSTLIGDFIDVMDTIGEIEDWADTKGLKAAGGQKTKDGIFVNYNWPVGTGGLVISISRRGKTQPYLNIRKWVKG